MSSSPAPIAPGRSGAPASDRPRVLYLGGLGRSGTTVLERVLGEMPGACSVGELVYLWERGVLRDEPCGCGERFSRCPFWREVGTRGLGGWDPALAERMVALRHRVDRTRFIPGMLFRLFLRRRTRDDLAEFVSNFIPVYRAISEVAGGAVVVDSSKHPSLAFCLRTTPDVDLRVVHVVRDSRGVAYSWTKEVRRPEADGGKYTLMVRYSPTKSALLWSAHNLLFALLGRLGVPVRRLRYEDFVSAPGPALGELGRFAGLPAGAQQLSFLRGSSVTLSPSHTVSGNPMRFRTGEVPLRRDDAWREQLPRKRRWLVSALTSPLLARYGYLARSRR